MSTKWEPWDPREAPPFTLEDVVRAVPALVVLLLVFVAIIFAVPVLAALVEGGQG
jgi:hypothetical protein